MLYAVDMEGMNLLVVGRRGKLHENRDVRE
jgi:hypothetical protein